MQTHLSLSLSLLISLSLSLSIYMYVCICIYIYIYITHTHDLLLHELHLRLDVQDLGFFCLILVKRRRYDYLFLFRLARD